MTKHLIDRIPAELPEDIRRFISSSNIYDSSCSPEARVYFIDKENGCYLKCSAKGTLEKEFQMTNYFHSKGIGAEALQYISDDRDWLFTAAVAGEDCTHDVLIAEKDALQSRVLLHGDYCLPNIILDNWRISGFIDVGCGGVGDWHIDIFWGVWTLWFNLKTHQYQDRFLDAYGRDKADPSLLRVVAAAEVFG